MLAPSVSRSNAGPGKTGALLSEGARRSVRRARGREHHQAWPDLDALSLNVERAPAGQHHVHLVDSVRMLQVLAADGEVIYAHGPAWPAQKLRVGLSLGRLEIIQLECQVLGQLILQIRARRWSRAERRHSTRLRSLSLSGHSRRADHSVGVQDILLRGSLVKLSVTLRGLLERD